VNTAIIVAVIIIVGTFSFCRDDRLVLCMYGRLTYVDTDAQFGKVTTLLLLCRLENSS